MVITMKSRQSKSFEVTTNLCPSCGKPVSPKAYDCPTCGHPLRKPRRSLFGKLAKWSLIGFNLLMVIWLVSYLATLGEIANDAQSDAERAGTAIGGTIGIGAILVLWALGDIILGLVVLLTRPSK